MGDGTTTKPTSLPPCRRYICSHTPDGKSVFLPSPEQIYRGRDGVGGVARSYSVETVPAKLADDQDVKAYLSPHGDVSHLGQNIVVPNLKGSNCLVIDLGPGGESQMHQTVSIDFSICVIGTIDMELDGGERVRLSPGDHIIQRGTMHKWINASKTEPARFIGVTLPCEPFKIGEEMLEEKHIRGTGALQPNGSRL